MARALEGTLPLSAPRVTLGERVVERLVPLAIVLIAAGMRLIGLMSVGLNSDEAVYSGQAAAIAGDPLLSPFFPIFRAHPLLVQTLLALPFSVEISDTAARLTAAAIGLATIVAVYGLGSRLYGRQVGALAALFLALMPYHVIVSRQFLLDGPMTLLTTLSLYCLVQFGTTNRHAWMYAAAAMLGLALMAKETAIVFLGATYAFLALTPALVVRLRHLVIATFTLVAVVAWFPLSLVLAGGGGATTAQQYFVWQVLRRPNHDLLFYPTVVPQAIGPVLIVAAIASLWLFRSRANWRVRLLLAWAVMPIAFFELWPTKGFQYLVAVAPVIAILAARVLVHWIPEHVPAWYWRVPRLLRQPRAIAIAVVLASLAIPSAGVLVLPPPAGGGLAGGGGVVGGREAGQWIDLNTPPTARLMTIGPSMGNILQFYGHRASRALSVSPDPLKRNPSYDPIRNADLSIRTGEFQYLVWDAYSAARTAHFSTGLLDLVRRYDGRLVHVETVPGGPFGASIATPVIQIYEIDATATASGGVVDAAGAGRPAARREFIYVAYSVAVTIAVAVVVLAVIDRRRTRLR